MYKDDYEFRKRAGGQQAYYQGDRSGISIVVSEFYGHREIEISGWYDSNKGIIPVTLPLKEFLEGLGITKNDLE